MKYASVCSGVEAASLAWMPLGWEAAWFSEIEPFPCAVLKERFPNVPNLGDMTKIKVENLENGDQRFTSGNGADVIVRGGVDLLVGGTPCQSFSVAGKREGLEGASGLAKTFVELLGSIRPKWFVWENVPGCLSSKSDRGIYDFNFLLAAFAERGYSCGWRILDAQFCRVDGYPRAVPQRRRRVFVIGHLGGWQYPAAVLFEPKSLSGNNPPRRVKGKGFTADAERSVGAASRPWDESGVNPTPNQCGAGSGIIGASNQELFSQNFNGLVMNQNQVAATLDTHYGDKQGLEDQHVNAGCPNFVIEKHDQETPICNAEGFGNPVTANHNGMENVVCYDSRRSSEMEKQKYYNWHSQNHSAKEINDDCSPTIPAAMGMGGSSMTTPMLIQECYAIDSTASNSMKSANPNSGFHKEDIAKTLDTTDPNPTKNQGGNVVVESVAIAENIIGRQVQNGGNGVGAQEELAYTQNTSGVMGVANHATVRRLLPIETERLMAFPDNWTRIPWKGKPEEECPDSPRYKACGNSMCVNVMRWIGMRIEMIERKEN